MTHVVNIVKYLAKFYLDIQFYGTIKYPLPVLPGNEQDLCHENIHLVNTYLFYQVCKVHDIVCLGDQFVKIKKVSHFSFRHFCLKLVSQLNFWQSFVKKFGNDTVTIQDTSFRQKCLKLKCEAFYILADLSPRQTMPCNIHTW